MFHGRNKRWQNYHFGVNYCFHMWCATSTKCFGKIAGRIRRRISFRKQHQVSTFGTFSVLILVWCSSRGGSIRKLWKGQMWDLRDRGEAGYHRITQWPSCWSQTDVSLAQMLKGLLDVSSTTPTNLTRPEDQPLGLYIILALSVSLFHCYWKPSY